MEFPGIGPTPESLHVSREALAAPSRSVLWVVPATYLEGAAGELPKSTFGATEMAFSFSTVKFGLRS
jgi:hypothetical protein